MDRYARARIRQVAAMLFVYATFYVCRLAFSASKKGMIEQGAYTPAEIGYIGITAAWLFFGNAPEDEGLPPVPVDAADAKIDTTGGQKIALTSTALGIAGMGNYIGAGLQSIISGYLIKRAEDGTATLMGHTFAGGYTLDWLAVFWIAMASLSVVCVIWAGRRS